ncbi:uncharacterized protein LOC135093955 isoform X1 [Scylla paramamosain]|uniref:uncharacterized protein LOC135093955 isoform X1 n=1 Tax=Scylla paramamosain TaxID=85552 RepID=UPI0030827DB8
MGEEGERRKRISTNPFLYTDGSLVEDDVLQAQLSVEEPSSGGSASPSPRCHDPPQDITSSSPRGQDIADPDHTPQAEMPSRQVWTQARTNSRTATSIDIDDEKLQSMTGSYSEILERPLLKQGIAEADEEAEDDGKEEMDAVTPVYSEMDPVQAFLSQERLSAFMARDDSLGEMPDYGNDAPQDSKERPVSLRVGRCSPDQAESALQGSGMVTRQGDIISFVADDLHSKIKLASPVSKSVVSFPGSRSSTPSLLRTALDLQVPPIDPSTINDIERHARHIATSVDTLIENLTGTLHSISALTVDCVETYRDAVCKTCDAVDANIKSMYQLMAKTEELSKSMKPIYKLQEQIKEVRRLLDMFENLVHSCGA